MTWAPLWYRLASPPSRYRRCGICGVDRVAFALHCSGLTTLPFLDVVCAHAASFTGSAVGSDRFRRRFRLRDSDQLAVLDVREPPCPDAGTSSISRRAALKHGEPAGRSRLGTGPDGHRQPVSADVGRDSGEPTWSLVTV